MNTPFSMQLADDNTLSSHSQAQAIIRDDLIYLSKRLSVDFRFTNFKQLCIYSCGNDWLN